MSGDEERDKLLVQLDAIRTADLATSEASNFRVIQIGSGLLLGFSNDQTCALIVDPEGGSLPVVPRRLENLSVLAPTRVQVQIGDESRTIDKALLIHCQSSQREVQDLFIDIVTRGVLDADSTEGRASSILKLVDHLAELFRSLGRPPGSTLGLWGELMVLSLSTDPQKLASFWHRDSSQTFDFQSKQMVVEVKTSTRDRRVHRFSAAQLSPPAGVDGLIISILAREVADGLSVESLRGRVLDTLTSDPSLVERVNLHCAAALGRSWPTESKRSYSLMPSGEGVRFYDMSTAPRLSSIPAGISNVTFDLDIERYATEASQEEFAADPLGGVLRLPEL